MVNERKNLKVFGYGLAVILTFIAFKIWRVHGWGAFHLLLVPAACALAVVTARDYMALKPLYVRWMRVAHFIGNIVTGLILSILFYCVFGIAGLVLRALRKDILDRGMDPQAKSYWTVREPADFDPQFYTRQF